jgi:hypothetical protein
MIKQKKEFTRKSKKSTDKKKLKASMRSAFTVTVKDTKNDSDAK